MKKVYLVAKDDLVAEAPMIVCESGDDAIALIDLWGEDYTIFEVPYIVAKVSTWFPYEGTPKSRSSEVEPMPFIGKPATAKDTLPKVPMDEVRVI